ncbi:hypothetical protein O1611_g6300 [Lasiodiplodia mahajangana]|uniref:Uncharacterized protein n=1 Tax=Lasiodiplodia mahajangana TaxID=1108764 RepID=A0ACC2JIH4_9PEZI|nr:hypothetical protein O1611_g6300 [Lasiodiplodia mahajangana]
MDIVGLISATGAILGSIVSGIEKATDAWDRTKNGKKYLDDVVIQTQITQDILGKLGGADPQSLPEETFRAIELVKAKAEDLDTVVKQMQSSRDGNSLKVFLSEFFHGNARVKAFDRLQRDMYHAQGVLITSLVASRVENTNIFHVNLYTVEEIKQCFTQREGINCAPPILQLLKDKGTPVEGGDGTIWQIKEEDLKNFLEETKSSEPETVRIMQDNKLKDMAFMTADVGNPGEDAPKVDVVRAVGNELTGSALMIAGPVTFKTAAEMQVLREALPVLRSDKKEALNALNRVLNM